MPAQRIPAGWDFFFHYSFSFGDQSSTGLAFGHRTDFYKLHQRTQELMNELPGRLIGQPAVLVKLLCGIADHHFRLIDNGHVQRDENLSKMILCAGCSQAADRSPHHRRRFAQPGAIAIRSRRPVDSVLEAAGQ